eukprot:276187-Pelagomonas_calceolata.AAC.9
MLWPNWAASIANNEQRSYKCPGFGAQQWVEQGVGFWLRSKRRYERQGVQVAPQQRGTNVAARTYRWQEGAHGCCVAMRYKCP